MITSKFLSVTDYKFSLLKLIDFCFLSQIVEAVANIFRNVSAENVWSNIGDPCVPTSWEWVTCSATQPPRITKM